jgi:hypothetical protein
LGKSPRMRMVVSAEYDDDDDDDDDDESVHGI